MGVSLSEMHPSSPCRRPDWRWHWAHFLFGRNKPIRSGHIDDQVRMIVNYLEAVKRSEQDGSRLEESYHPMVKAQRLYQSGQHERWEIEARLLAGEDVAVIAARLGLEPETIRAFHDAFFDVQPHLAAKDYIVNCVLDSRFHRGTTEDDRAFLLKMFGYLRGPAAIDHLLHYFRSPPPPSLANVSCLTDAELHQADFFLRTRAGILSEVIPVTPSTAERWLLLNSEASRTEGDLPPEPLLLRGGACLDFGELDLS